MIDEKLPIVSKLDFIIDYIKENKLASINKDVYEFGIFSGNSTTSFLNNFKLNNIQYDNYYAFDSLCGLPEEAKGIKIPPNWHKGAFSSISMYNMKTTLQAKLFFEHKFKDFNFKLIDGFFDKTLNDNLVKEHKFKPALFISIDVDLYISSFQCMDWLFKNKIICKDTIVRYDDWLSCDAGQKLAHRELKEKYNFNFEILEEKETVIIRYL